jgi:hypothetical protein
MNEDGTGITMMRLKLAVVTYNVPDLFNTYLAGRLNW